MTSTINADGLMTLAGWVGPTLAFVGLFIAWLNYRQKTQQHKLALYDRRTEIHGVVVQLWASMESNAGVTKEAFKRFGIEYTPGAMLFCYPTIKLLGIVAQEAFNNMRLKIHADRLPTGPEKDKAIFKCGASYDNLKDDLFPRICRKMAKEISPAESLVPWRWVKWWAWLLWGKIRRKTWARNDMDPWWLDKYKTKNQPQFTSQEDKIDVDIKL